MNKVLAAIDDSAAARPVLAMAAALAAALGATVEAVHVSDGDGRTARGSANHLGIQYVTVPGDPLERLAELAAGPDVMAVTAGSAPAPGVVARRGTWRSGWRTGWTSPSSSFPLATIHPTASTAFSSR